MILTSTLATILSYALGCFSVGYYLVRWRTGQDLRTVGSGATGGRNAGRVLGARGAVVIGIGDCLKGVIAVALGRMLHLEVWALGLIAIAVLAGHVWPAQLAFHGGKGLSVAFGAVLIYDYRIALLTAAVAIPLFILSRRGERFFLAGIATAPILSYLLGSPRIFVAELVVIVAVILYAHRENLRAS